MVNLKDTKIFIPEIPKEWTHMARSGHTNIWNDKFYKSELPEVRLEPPMHGLYAKRFEDGWYWICGCHKCLGIDKSHSYIVCDDHNRCITCGTHRNDLTEIPWWHAEGFQCKSCAAKEYKEKKNAAIMAAQARGHSEDDCYREDRILCPVCGNDCTGEEGYKPGEEEITCEVCDTDFIVNIEIEVKYTSFMKF